VQIKVIKLSFKTIMWGILFCIGTNIAISMLFDTSERLRQRFDIQDTEYQSETTASRLYVYTAFINVIQLHPFGTGYREAYLPGITSKRLFLHNSYLTYILGGGIFSLVGVLLLLRELLNLSISFVRRRKIVSNLQKKLEPINLSFIIYFLTLVSIEQGGLFFFFILSLGIFCSKYNYE
jgi:O-antigen ligase